MNLKGAAATVFLMVSVVVLSQAPVAEGAYSARNLGTTDGVVFGLNVMGQALTGPYLWSADPAHLSDGASILAPALDMVGGRAYPGAIRGSLVNTWGEVPGAVIGGFYPDGWPMMNAAVWSQGFGPVSVTPPTLGGDNSYGYMVNEAGWVAGGSDTVPGDSVAGFSGFVWVPPTNRWSWPPPPPASPGLYSLGSALGEACSDLWFGDMNDRGQVVGFVGGGFVEMWCAPAAGMPLSPVIGEFVSGSGAFTASPVNLGTWSLAADSDGHPMVDINNRGQLVTVGIPSTGYDGLTSEGVLVWDSPASGNPPRNLGLPPGPWAMFPTPVNWDWGGSILLVAINDRGQVLTQMEGNHAGSVAPAVDSWLWDPLGGWIEIPPVPPDWTYCPSTGSCTITQALGMNNAGQVVGITAEVDYGGENPVYGNVQGFVWTSAAGSVPLSGLSAYCVLGGPCFPRPVEINDMGQVAGEVESGGLLLDTIWQRDADPIADLIDSAPDTPCPGYRFYGCFFDDRSIQRSDGVYGKTYGEIRTVETHRVVIVDQVYDEPSTTERDDGVKILVLDNPSDPPARFRACSPPFDLDVSAAQGGAILTCGSLHLAVGAGEWIIDLANAPVLVPAGAAVSLEEAGGGAITVTSDPESTAVVTVGGVPLHPGESITVTTNAPPVAAIEGPASGAVFPVGTPVTFTGSFTDADAGDTHTATWDFDGVTVHGTVVESGGVGTVTADYAFLTPGIYHATLTVADDKGAGDTADTVDDLPAFVVVYDPDGGFVTGGGWIDSPPGAYVPNPLLTGRATFGFVSKYQKGANAPSGQTEFRFKVADFAFHSTAYEWLVCGGPKCQYKGTGTVNGQGGYGFLLSAIDGALPGGGGQDKLRMKVWDQFTGQVVYDNQLGADEFADPTTVIGGGSIVIHK